MLQPGNHGSSPHVVFAEDCTMFALLFCALVKQWLMRTRVGCQGFDMLILSMNGTIYLS
jgi:hypothetical protein